MEDISTSFASHQLRQTAEQLAPSAVEFNKQYWDEAYLPLKGSVRVPLRLIWVASVSTLVSHFMECFSGTKKLTQEAFMQKPELKDFNILYCCINAASNCVGNSEIFIS